MLGSFWERSTSLQNPEQGYLYVEIPNSSCYVVPVPIGRFYVGRASNPRVLAEFCKKIPTASGWVCLPLSTEKSRLSPVYWLDVRDSICEINNGWPREHGERQIIINLQGGKRGLAFGEKTLLNGFEKIELPVDPACKMIYIPPLFQYKYLLSSKNIRLLEDFSLWASAGLGWFILGKFARSVSALETALEFPMNFDVNAKLKLLLAKALSRLDYKKYQAIIETYQRQAMSNLNIPIIDFNIDGKVFLLGLPGKLTITGCNLSPDKAILNLVIILECPTQKIKKWWSLGTIPPNGHLVTKTPPLLLGESGVFDISIIAKYSDAHGKYHELFFHDVIIVRRQKPKIIVKEDVALVDVLVDETDDYPDIYSNASIGSIWFRRHNSRNDA